MIYILLIWWELTPACTSVKANHLTPIGTLSPGVLKYIEVRYKIVLNNYYTRFYRLKCNNPMTKQGIYYNLVTI